MTIRAVVFDVGGVLALTPEQGVMDRWEQRLGLYRGQMRELLEEVFRPGSVGAMDEKEVYRSIGHILDLHRRLVVAFMDEVWAEYLGTPNQPLIDFFRGLRPRYRTAILSNSFVGAREREEARYGFSAITDQIVYSHEVGMSKPEPRIYELTCGRLGVRPDETLFVDDRPEMVDGARQTGLYGVHYVDRGAIDVIEAALLPQIA